MLTPPMVRAQEGKSTIAQIFPLAYAPYQRARFLREKGVKQCTIPASLPHRLAYASPRNVTIAWAVYTFAIATQCHHCATLGQCHHWPMVRAMVRAIPGKLSLAMLTTP